MYKLPESFYLKTQQKTNKEISELFLKMPFCDPSLLMEDFALLAFCEISEVK
jgi:hypothetical protein